MRKYPSIVQVLSTWTHISYKIIEDQIQFLEPLSPKNCQGSRCCSCTNSITSNRSLVGLSVSALSIHHSGALATETIAFPKWWWSQTACRFMKFSSPKTQNKIPGNTTYLYRNTTWLCIISLLWQITAQFKWRQVLFVDHRKKESPKRVGCIVSSMLVPSSKTWNQFQTSQTMPFRNMWQGAPEVWSQDLA